MARTFTSGLRRPRIYRPSPPEDPFCPSIGYWRNEFARLSPTEATEYASTLHEPVRVVVEAKDEAISTLYIQMVDGRHRSTSAFEAGAARIRARVQAMWLGKFVGDWLGLIPLPIGAIQL